MVFSSAFRWACAFLVVLVAPITPSAAPEAMERAFRPPPPLVQQDAVRQALLNPWRVQPVPAAFIDGETLWLARLMFSESKQPDEQELVGWVARNRAETGYRGCHTIEAVARDPYQFSAFTEGKPSKDYYVSLTPHTRNPGWQRTLALAHYLRHADPSLRPFSKQTRHFFSERSLAVPDSLPAWTIGRESVVPARPTNLDPLRFRFYAGVL